MKKVLLAILILCVTYPAMAASDKWGGDDRVRNPTSKYQTGDIEALTSYTMTDSDASWTTNELADCILQIDADGSPTEFYMLIKSNTATVITVYGSDPDPGPDCSADGDECATRALDDFGAVSGTYAILDQWSVQKVNQRWWFFDPYGNAWWGRSLNNLTPSDSRYGASNDGTTWAAHMNAHPEYGGHGTGADDLAATLYEIIGDKIKPFGFNALGSSIEYYYMYAGSGSLVSDGEKTANRLMPFIAQVRIEYNYGDDGLTMTNTDSFEVSSQPTSDPAEMRDPFDTDFQSDIETDIANGNGSSAATYEFYTLANSRTSWASQYITPYEKASLNHSANPYMIGLDWDEEPKYAISEASTYSEHLGYLVMVSASSTGRKCAAVDYLYGEYGTIAALNTAWGTSFDQWGATCGYSSGSAEVEEEDGTNIDALLDDEPYCRSWLETTTPNLEADLNSIAEMFYRQYAKEVSEAMDNLFEAPRLLFGPGFHGWIGDVSNSDDGTTSYEYLFRAAVSADQATTYIDVILVGDPMHGRHESVSATIYEHMGQDLKDRYVFHGRPYWHESCWITAEADSAITHAGTLTSNPDSDTLTDSTADFDGTPNSDNYPSGNNSPYHMILICPSNTCAAIGAREYFTICYSDHSGNCPTPWVGGTTMDVFYEITDSNWSYSTSPDLTVYGSGDNYYQVAHDAVGQMTSGADLYIPLTQEDRATMYVNFLDEATNLQAANGDYIVVGYSEWSWFDFAHKDNTAEFRNFGWMTVELDLYDGTAKNLSNDVCGDFVTPVSTKLNGLYQEMIGSSFGSGSGSFGSGSGSFSGVQ